MLNQKIKATELIENVDSNPPPVVKRDTKTIAAIIIAIVLGFILKALGYKKEAIPIFIICGILLSFWIYRYSTADRGVENQQNIGAYFKKDVGQPLLDSDSNKH